MLLQVSPRLLGHVVSPEVPWKVLYRAALLLEATVSTTHVEQQLIGFDGRLYVKPYGRWEASLLQAP